MTQKRILIYLHAEKTSWLIMDETGQIEQTVLQGDLNELSPAIDGHDIRVIVPGQSILLTSVQLPKLNPQRLKQALPFALEEQLIDDINTLHFATGQYQANETYPVAVVSNDVMETWITKLNDANIIPHALIPAPLALPFAPDNIYLCMDDTIAIARTTEYSGFSCDKDNLDTLLKLHLAESEKTNDIIHLYNFTSTSSDLKIETVTLNETLAKPEEFLTYLMQWTETFPFINLLQGDYQTSKKASGTQKIWIAAGIVAVVWLGFSLINNIGSYFILHHATAKSEQQIEQIYKRNFPLASSVVAPRQRMEEKLKKLSGSANKNNFLSMLAVVGDNLPKATGIQLLSLDYRGNQLTLNVNAMSFENLDHLIQALTRQHLIVKQQNASMAGTTVKANLQITQGAL